MITAMPHEIISTTEAPKAIGPYSQAVKVGCVEMVFTSGQIPIDHASGEVVKGDIALQTETVLRNLAAVLKATGMGVENVVKTTVFLTDLADFAKMNEVYGKFFPSRHPARSTVQVAALPKGVSIEIEAVAVRTA